VEEDEFNVGDPFMSEDECKAFIAWKVARGLRSDDDIKTFLQEYGFLPEHDMITEAEIAFDKEMGIDVPSHRDFLCLSDDPARKHEREITEDEIRAMDLVPCGSFDVGEISETYWVPRGHPSGDNNYSWDDVHRVDEDNIPF
jgi:hypothetical protein